MKLKSISRIDSRKTHGWYVRVRYMGQEHRKLFSDGKYGNKLSSLIAAKKYRDELEISLGKPRTNRLVIASNRRNRTGVVGVRRREFPAFEAQVSIRPGKIKKVLIPIKDGDEQAAFNQACRVRQEMLQKFYCDDNRIEF
jgi:hypothetical protein